MMFIDLSNWMRFVRPAKVYEEMNVTVVQSKDSLFFITSTIIQPKQELLVGYSEQYAAKRQLSILQPQSGNRFSGLCHTKIDFFLYFQLKMLKMSVTIVTSHLPRLKDSRSI